MDPPLDLSPEDRRHNLDAAFIALVESSPSLPISSTKTIDANFIKRAPAPRIQIMLAASKLKALALSEKGLIG